MNNEHLRVTDYEINPLMAARWSPRSFSQQAISEAALLQLFEAARWAPSAMNRQPWRFAWALRDTGGFERLLACLRPFNQAWAHRAAALVVVLSQTTQPTADGGEQPNPSHAFDTGAAWAQFALQACEYGWVAHAMGGLDHEALRASLGLAPTWAIHCIVAIGERGDPSLLSPELQARETPSSRLSVAQISAPVADEGAWQAP